MINLSSFIRFHALQTPEKIAIVYGDLRITYHEFNDRILATAGMMTDAGIKAGDVIALVMKNSPAFLDIAFATSHIGAIFVPINFHLTPDEIRYVLTDAGARLLFIDDEGPSGENFQIPTVILKTEAKDDNK